MDRTNHAGCDKASPLQNYSILGLFSEPKAATCRISTESQNPDLPIDVLGK
jgi:hypothetical protein